MGGTRHRNRVHVVHPLLKEGAVEFRGYQANLARIAERRDTLVVIPTGMGKTIVALLVVADALKAGAQRILLLAPTRPLVEQHAASFAALLAPPWNERVRSLTGDDAPAKRASAYGDPGLVVATPQVVHNDLVNGRFEPAAFDWVVFDEAHRAVGDYPYVFLGTEFQRRAPQGRRLGLTASPGHEVRKIDEVRSALGLGHVEIRTPADPDVAPFVHDIGVEWEALPLPPNMARVSRKLQEALTERIRSLKGLGFLKEAGSRPRRRDLLLLQSEVQGILQRSPTPEPSLYTALSLQAQAMKLQHAIELVETQGAAAFAEYLEGVREEAKSGKPSKATQSVLADARVNEAYHVASFDDSENPKMGRTGVLVQEAVEKDPAARVIVFTHYRQTCEAVCAHLATRTGLRPALFVGQQSRGAQEGLTQKEQREVLDRFRAGEVNVLVATSVAEEGLDIPEVDLVVFYEPIPSEIRAIQRRGRTGRKRAGRVVVLMTKGTQDEAAHWASRRREQEMVRELQALRTSISGRPAAPPALPKGQSTLAEPAMAPSAPSSPERTTLAPSGASPAPEPLATSTEPAPAASSGPRIYFDHREQAGGVVRHLHELGARLEGRQLDAGDFVLSDRVLVERKETADFVDSLVDGRLFEQMRALKAWPRPFLVIEGESLYGHRNVSPEALLGAVASIVGDYGVPVLQTRDALETARFLVAAAKREQGRENRKLAVRSAKPAMTDRERQLYLLCGLPGVSDTLAERLLGHFGSVSAVFTASVLDLAAVDGIGAQKASEIRRILDLPATSETARILGLSASK